MRTYRMYSLNEFGRIDYAEEIGADDDGTAIARVRDVRPNALLCEVWDGRRLVATLKGGQVVAEKSLQD